MYVCILILIYGLPPSLYCVPHSHQREGESERQRDREKAREIERGNKLHNMGTLPQPQGPSALVFVVIRPSGLILDAPRST